MIRRPPRSTLDRSSAASDVYKRQKCKKIKTKMQRHHKANDFFFAMAMPHIFAARYILFHSDDVDLLCASCHKSWHRYVEPKLVTMYDEYRMMPSKPDKEWCEDCLLYTSP